jgi:hypothetical protein
MAEKLDDFDWGDEPKVRGQKYPYDEWLDGDTWVLEEGDDFDCKMSTMLTLLREQANKRSLKLDYRKNDDTRVLIIRARSQHAK